MRVFGILGWSGSGKTALITRLLPELTRRGFRVSTVKHAHHEFDTDIPGKDSYEHRKAGASEVLISSAKRWALMHENGNDPEPRLNDLMDHLAPADLLLVEGFKAEKHDKIEVRRQGQDGPFFAGEDATVVAIASDGPVKNSGLPVLDLNNVSAIANFIAVHCGLDSARHGAA